MHTKRKRTASVGTKPAKKKRVEKKEKEEVIPLEDGRITFDSKLESIESFISRFAPSNTDSSLADWIQVHHPEVKPREADSYDDVGAIAEWEAFQEEDVTADLVRELGMKYSIYPGKWLLFFGARKLAAMEKTWESIATALVENRISATDAKISTQSRTYILCVYTKDFTDIEDVMKVREELRKLGVTNKIHYKADVYTILDIYKKNDWGLPEMLYSK